MSASSHNPNPTKKARTACRNWPNCTYGEKCKFAHDPMLGAMKIEMDRRMTAAAAAMAPIRRQQELCKAAGINFGEYGIAAEPMKKNLIGEQLYSKITVALKEGEETMRETGISHAAITAGKITGMILEAYTCDELLEIGGNPDRIGALMLEACVAIKSHAERGAAGHAWL